MDNDPKSYRVPILHLKDVLGDDENKEGGDTPIKNTTSNPRETSSETFPIQYIEETKDAEATTQVFEKDIEAAVITPVLKKEAVLEKKDEEYVAEKPEKPSVPTPLKKTDVPAKVSGVDTSEAKITGKQSISSEVTDTPKQKETVLEESSKPIHETHIEIERQKQPTSEILITKSSLDSSQDTSSFKAKKFEEITKEKVKETPFEKKEEQVIPSPKPFFQTEKKEEVKQGSSEGSVTKIIREINPLDTQEKAVENKLTPLEKKESPDEKMSGEKLSASMLDDSGADSIFSLIEDSLQSEAHEETPRVEKAPEPEAFIEKVEIKKEAPRKKMPKIPAPDMLDIWEQDAAKPRVPYHPKKPTLPTPPAPSTVETDNKKPITPVLPPPNSKEKKDEIKTNKVPESIKNSIDDSEKKEVQKPIRVIETTQTRRDSSLQNTANKNGKKTAGIFKHIKEEDKTPTSSPKTGETHLEIKEAKKTPEDTVTTPLQRLIPKEEKQSSSDKKSDTAKLPSNSSAGLSNLSALRDRVLKESHLHDSVHPVQVEEGLAKKRQKDLVQTDLHKLDSIAKTIDKEKNSVDTEQKEQHQFASKHAQAVADIATRMHENKDPNALALEKAVSLAQSLEVDGDMATLPKIKVLGALEEAVIKPSYKTPESSVPMIRTFRQDVEQAVTRNRTSMVDMITAEQKRRESGEMFRQAPRQETSSWSYVFIGASMVLVIGALAVGAYLAFRLATKPPSEIIPERIPLNETISYDTTGQTKDQILSGLVGVRDALHSSLGSVTEVQLTERKSNTDDTSAKTNFVTTSSFLQRIETRAPGNLVRSLNDSMLLGVHELRKNEAFLVFTALSYDEAFSGMFEWESSMNKDLAPLFGVSLEATAEAEHALLYKKVTVGTSTATSSIDTVSEEPQIPVAIAPAQFEDMFVANIPARGLKNSSGETVLIWSMPDEITIVITTNESTMRMILEYMASQTF